MNNKLLGGIVLFIFLTGCSSVSWEQMMEAEKAKIDAQIEMKVKVIEQKQKSIIKKIGKTQNIIKSLWNDEWSRLNSY